MGVAIDGDMLVALSRIRRTWTALLLAATTSFGTACVAPPPEPEPSAPEVVSNEPEPEPEPEPESAKDPAPAIPAPQTPATEIITTPPAAETQAKPMAMPEPKPVPPPLPSFTIVIRGAGFTEAQIRKPVETGLAYAMDRVRRYVGTGGRVQKPFTLTYLSSSNPYVSGEADDNAATIWVPPSYPLTGENQNYVVNLTIHEIGHILTHNLIASRSVQPSICVNEGIATWIAGRYWANVDSKAVGSLRVAARAYVDRGSVYPSMTNCVRPGSGVPSDPWYKLYGSFFEYLATKPGAISAVSNGKTPASEYVTAWGGWLD